MKKSIQVGVIIGVHGIRGEVKIRSLLENSALLEGGILLDKSGNELFSVKITGKLKDAIIAKIASVSDRNSAESLRGKELFIPASHLPEIGEDEFYHSQLIGLQARTQNGEIIGKINNILNFGAGDIVEIEMVSGETEMLPFSAPWVGEINPELGFVVISLPPTD